ncbi:MAG: hypothetical protein E7399_08115 [Ruminococcaceae bacterium]|nr:hypothetical protein [Oscillospiraceae bacterium]
MKAMIMQPPYSRDTAFSDEYFAYKLELLNQCDESADLIVLPEYSDVPCATATREETLEYHKKYCDILLGKCMETAKRCGAVVCVNALCEVETGYRNTTYVYDKQGNLAGRYFKRHLPASEMELLELDSDYTNEPSAPFILELDGVRYAFLTCYDFYFYEAFARIAREQVDIIIGCSLQRSDSHDAIEIMCRFLAYHTNAYVVRSSVSFDEKSKICGASMIVAPDGTILENMGGKFGMACAEFDPKKKYLKPAGFGRELASHYEYIEDGRKPWQYRHGGSAIVKREIQTSYPRVCAHRGFSTIAPENSMPAFGAAVAMGAEEIEFDLWYTKDGEIVSIHDATLDRISNGTGFVFEHTYEELKELDFGSKYGEQFQGIKLITFEEILKKFACHVIMNIHIKTRGDDAPYDENLFRKIIALIDQYDCRKHIYFMSTDRVLEMAKNICPDICRCTGEEDAVLRKEKESTIVERAITMGNQKVQLFKPYFSKAEIDLAHKHGIQCNVFWSDDPKEATKFLEMGIDTILTNDFHRVNQAVQEYKKQTVGT